MNDTTLLGEVASEELTDFDVQGITDKPMPNAVPGVVIGFVLWLRRFFIKLADLVVPADAVLFERCTGIAQTQIFGALARWEIADLLSKGPMNAKAIAEHVGANEDAVHRILRAACTVGVFKMNGAGEFENNRLSKALISGQATRAKEFAEYFASQSNSKSYLEIDHILKTGADGFEHTNGMDLWDWFDAHPEERETFAQMMMGVTFSEAPMVAKLYPFNEIKRLCDVGGGRGGLISELAIRYPHLECVLFDCEGVIESAKPLLEARNVSDRVETVVGNFYEKIVPGCDAYILKNVMHDWDDGRCITILKKCHEAAKPGDRVLLVEIIVEPNDRANFGSLRDVHVLTVCTGGGYRKYKAPICPSSEVSYPKPPHSFTAQAPIFTVGPTQIA